MKKIFIPIFVLSVFFFISCGDGTTDSNGIGDMVEDVIDGDYFYMKGDFEDGVYSNTFEVESRYWPSFVMVIPENTDLANEKFEAVAIFDDYGIANETYPVGSNISFFQQSGNNADRKTLVEIEDREADLYLDDANMNGVAYSLYDERMDVYDVYYYDIEKDEEKQVASGDGEKINSYASVTGDKIYWTEVDGDDFSIFSDGIGYEKEEVLFFENAWGVMMESHGDYIVFSIETYDDDYNFLSNDIIVYDVNKDEEIEKFSINLDYEVISGNYDGENLFITAYDYGISAYVNSQIDDSGEQVINDEESFETTFTGAGTKNFLMRAQENYHEDYYEADYIDSKTGEERSFSDILNAGVYNDYFFYIECDVASTGNLINSLTLSIEQVK